ncbi:Uncharacterised protein [Helicobacter mustelae]|nr:Uncharacterised protein [Helicobacter mustelae]
MTLKASALGIYGIFYAQFRIQTFTKNPSLFTVKEIFIYGYQLSARILRFKTYTKDLTPPYILINKHYAISFLQKMIFCHKSIHTIIHRSR